MTGINPLDNAYASAAKLKELIDDDLCAGYYYPQKEGNIFSIYYVNLNCFF